MIKWFAKKYVIGLLNDLLSEYKNDIDKAKDMLNLWINRIDKVLFTLRSMLNKLDDNKVTDEEVEQITSDITTAIKAW